jgi:hypothetical protein
MTQSGSKERPVTLVFNLKNNHIQADTEGQHTCDVGDTNCPK